MKPTPSSRVARASLLLCAALLSCVPSAAARQQSSQQQPSPQSQQQQEEDVLRVSTNLVQTDVTVVDKQGRFAEGLTRDDFELKVDGKPQPLLFFERVAAGGIDEARRIAAARGESVPASSLPAAARGRAVIFFVDDIHLSPQGLQAARRVLNKIIDEELTPDVQALVVSPSGRIGFLQQFTNEKAVLRAAVARLAAPDARGMSDSELPPMSFYQAVEIDRGNRDLLEYLIQQTIIAARPFGMPRTFAETQVKNRALRIRRQAAQLSSGVLGALEQAVAVNAPTEGRRLLYFFSEGFTLDPSEADSFNRFGRVVDAAARSGTVIYTLDTRGLAVGMRDASSSVGADIMAESESGLASAFGSGASPTLELSATQDVLRGLAADTGGRALLNTNALEAALSKTLAETANYYLLAWRPEGVESDAKGAPRFRKIEISVRNRPDLRARVRRGTFAGRPPAVNNTRASAVRDTPTNVAADPSKSANASLNSELNAETPNRALAVEVYAVPTSDAPGQTTLTAFVQVDGSRLTFAPVASGRKVAEVEAACVVLDDKGKPVYSTGRRLTLDGSNASSSSGAGVALLTSFDVPALAPGIYQVRVAARELRGGLVGSARHWTELPDLKSRRLALSGLVLVESRAGGVQDAAALRPSVNRVFARGSKMLVELYIHNAAGATPDLEMALRVLDRGKELLAAPTHKVSTAGNADPARIRYVAEIPLRSLAPGSYLLELSVTDRNARTTAKRQLTFAVE